MMSLIYRTLQLNWTCFITGAITELGIKQILINIAVIAVVYVKINKSVLCVGLNDNTL